MREDAAYLGISSERDDLSLNPRILVTNDDGYFSDGLAALAQALEAVGEVTVVAPTSEQSATAHSITLTRPLRARQMGERRYSIDGTPTDCVLLAITKIMPERPHIVISGINHGANLGDDVTYSGTVAGALEASIFKLPGIAVSLTAREGDFTHAARFAAGLTGKVLKEGLPEGTILNVNVPPGEVRGGRFTHQGVAASESDIVEGVDPRGKPYYWIGVQKLSWKEDPCSDYAAIADGLVSITPLRTDLTDHRLLEKLKERSDLLPTALIAPAK
jgi:5'-nucleotidase